ncbi:stage V sporulation protein AA [Priestia taiwanensis]|nr:stage V sporulation protein AA [Priestia taiwanensis]MBM7361481.1 stage V sporulation protein AA [Priestia taiwanensis]
MSQMLYIRLRHRLLVDPAHPIKLKDIAELIGEVEIVHALQDIIIYEISKKDKTHVVLDIMFVLDAIKKHVPHVECNVIGPTQTLVEINVRKKKINPFFLIVTWLLLFVGAGLAIIYFHEDVSMQQVHQRIYYMITGEVKEKPLVFQIPYSIGLGVGMILFFNHVFQKRINEEPSPLEVEMFQYQQSLDQYVIHHDEKEQQKDIDRS